MPASSREILAFLDLLDTLKIDITTAEDYVQWFREDSGDIGIFSDEDRAVWRVLRTQLQRALRAKQVPTRDIPAQGVQALVELSGDELLDEAFASLELQKIPGMVQRWKRLQVLEFVTIPPDRVTESLRQAIMCYLYGLPDAAAVLCRAVLQVVLEDAFSRRGDLSLAELGKKKPEKYIESLIVFSECARVLSEVLAVKAHRIRRMGGQAAHRGGIEERMALELIMDTREILQHVYYASKRR
jgi:hypothetical protein